MSIAFIFPGQGSQAVGMGAELAKAYPAAQAVFSEVDEALGQKLSQLMWEGPEADLTLTENAQPALMAVSLAALRVLAETKGLALESKASYVALGEYGLGVIQLPARDSQLRQFHRDAFKTIAFLQAATDAVGQRQLSFRFDEISACEVGARGND
jgi:malonyl CoA-acyl carrier protein transacylase